MHLRGSASSSATPTGGGIDDTKGKDGGKGKAAYGWYRMPSGGVHREYYKNFYKAKGNGKLDEFLQEWGPPPSSGGQAFHPRSSHPYG
jgi:hypothetical protein